MLFKALLDWRLDHHMRSRVATQMVLCSLEYPVQGTALEIDFETLG